MSLDEIEARVQEIAGWDRPFHGSKDLVKTARVILHIQNIYNKQPQIFPLIDDPDDSKSPVYGFQLEWGASMDEPEIEIR
jgi:hypothetical protein